MVNSIIPIICVCMCDNPIHRMATLNGFIFMSISVFKCHVAAVLHIFSTHGHWVVYPPSQLLAMHDWGMWCIILGRIGASITILVYFIRSHEFCECIWVNMCAKLAQYVFGFAVTSVHGINRDVCFSQRSWWWSLSSLIRGYHHWLSCLFQDFFGHPGLVLQAFWLCWFSWVQH